VNLKIFAKPTRISLPDIRLLAQHKHKKSTKNSVSSMNKLGEFVAGFNKVLH